MNRRRRQRLEGKVGEFLRGYARKCPRHGEPNDRQYDRGTEEIVKRMSPEELDELMNGGSEEDE